MTEPEAGGAAAWVPEHPTLDALRAAAPGCRGCELWRDATQVVFSSGSPRAPIVLVGEQPGDQEDRRGEPFIGPAGGLLREALDAAALPIGEVYLTNAVKHFRHRVQGSSGEAHGGAAHGGEAHGGAAHGAEPRGKRRIHEKPGVTHIEACHPWLEAELGVVAPRVVVCLGATAGRSVLGRPVRIGAERGRVLEGERMADAAVVITTHPSALLRMRGKPGFDEQFDLFVADLELARRAAGGAL